MNIERINENSEVRLIEVATAPFFGLPEVSRIRRQTRIGITERSYLPKVVDPRSDWVATVAAPAFLALAQTGIGAPSFCSIGTGAGLDALAAIEILRSERVVVTDLHDDVVAQAHRNIAANVVQGLEIAIAGFAGDLLEPLADQIAAFDLIYKNLPNIPLLHEDLHQGQNSSTFIASRVETLPLFVSNALLALHHLALQQDAALLRPGGRVLSSIGGRVPLATILQLASETGYDGQILTYTWKIQSEPEDVVGGYARWEREGLGPFHFYPADVLSETFSNIALPAAGAQALEIERSLREHAISAAAALECVQSGRAVGHTVVVLESVKR